MIGGRLLRPSACFVARAYVACPLARGCTPPSVTRIDLSRARAMCTASTDSVKESEEAKKPLDYSFEGLAFEGGKDLMVRRLKMASILNLGFAAASAPILQYITSLSGNGGKGVAMSATLVIFGGTLTGMLTWISGTYVLHLKALPGGKKIEIATPTLFGGTALTEVEWAEIVRPTSYHPFSTFEAKGSVYYLDEDGTLHDPQFLMKIEEALNREVEDE